MFELAYTARDNTIAGSEVTAGFEKCSYCGANAGFVFKCALCRRAHHHSCALNYAKKWDSMLDHVRARPILPRIFEENNARTAAGLTGVGDSR